MFDPRPLQGEDPRANGVLTFMAQTSALTYAPGPRADRPGGRPLRTHSRLQPDELSPKVDGGANRQSLVAALGASTAQKPPAPHGEGDPGPRNPLRAPWKTARILSAPAALRKWPSPPGDLEDPPALDDGKAASSNPLCFCCFCLSSTCPGPALCTLPVLRMACEPLCCPGSLPQLVQCEEGPSALSWPSAAVGEKVVVVRPSRKGPFWEWQKPRVCGLRPRSVRRITSLRKALKQVGEHDQVWPPNHVGHRTFWEMEHEGFWIRRMSPLSTPYGQTWGHLT